MRTERSTAVRPRLAFLDALRALAALSVLGAHMFSELSPAFQRFRFSLFDLGSFGVTVFFLCSGYIIQPSIEHAPSLWSFWRRRFYRLYPLYWLSVLATAALIGLGLTRPTLLLQSPTLPTVLLNLTMVQPILGAPHLQVVYWSLTFELIFYLVISLFVLIRLNRYTALITTSLIGATLIVEVIAPLMGGPQLPLNICGFLVIMFSGALIARVDQGHLGPGVALGLILLGLSVNISAALVDSLLSSGGWWQHRYLICAWGGAYAVFLGVYGIRKRAVLALPPLQHIGRISYSIYLLHLPIILTIPPLGGPVLSALIWSALSIGLAAITFATVEQPMIARARAPRTPQAQDLQPEIQP